MRPGQPFSKEIFHAHVMPIGSGCAFVALENEAALRRDLVRVMYDDLFCLDVSRQSIEQRAMVLTAEEDDLFARVLE